MAKLRGAKKISELDEALDFNNIAVDDGTPIGKRMTKSSLKALLTIEGTEMEPLVGGTTSGTALVVPDGPAGEQRTAEVASGKWYDFGSGPVQASADRRWKSYWNGSSWSLKDMGELPTQPKTDSIEKTNENVITSRGVYPLKDALKSLGVILEGDVIAVSSDMTWLSGRLLNNLGNAVTTVKPCSISTNYLSIDKRIKKFRVEVDISDTALYIATYSEPAQGKQVQVMNNASAVSANVFEITRGANDNFFRASCMDSFIPNFKITVLEVDNSETTTDINDMLLNELYAVNSITKNSDSIISSADVTWQDGTPGILTYGDYNPTWQAYDSYQITYLSKTLSQPKVTRDSEGTIIISPLKQVS